MLFVLVLFARGLTLLVSLRYSSHQQVSRYAIHYSSREAVCHSSLYAVH